MDLSVSERLFAQAKMSIPGGVNSPVRACNAVGGVPLFVKSAKGSRIYDADGNQYIDYVGSWGPAILGHAHPAVIRAVCDVAKDGLSFGAPTEAETLLAEELTRAVPSMDLVRLVSSGTEACMSAIRVARGYTGRDLIIKFEGHYHGHADMLLVSAGSGAATFGNPTSAGVPRDIIRCTLSLPFNDIKALEDAFLQHKGQIAAVIAEPIAGNAGFIRPQPDFLKVLKRLCQSEGTLFIADEVMTGFRTRFGGAHQDLGLEPDLCTFGKIVGGGLPLAAFGGRRSIMEMLSPLGSVYQAGTLSGNPLAVASGLRTLELIRQDPEFYPSLAEKSRLLVRGLQQAAASHSIPVQADFEGGMFGIYFSDKPVVNFEDARQSRTDCYARFFGLMRERGICLAPSAYEAGFLSAAHSSEDLELTIAAADQAFRILAQEVIA